MVKKSLVTLFSLLIITFFLAFPSQVFAHVLKTDGPVGAVLHIDPDDDPIVGQEAHFYFDFKAQGTVFNIGTCTCVAKILENNNEVYSKALAGFDQDLTSAHFSFTFPEKGVYQVVVSGNQKIVGSTKNFKLVYDFRLERQSGSTSNTSNFFEQYSIFFVFGVIGLIFIGVYFFNKSS